MVKGPGYALGEILAAVGARVTIHGTTELPCGGISEHITITLDGMSLGADVCFEEDE